MDPGADKMELVLIELLGGSRQKHTRRLGSGRQGQFVQAGDCQHIGPMSPEAEVCSASASTIYGCARRSYFSLCLGQKLAHNFQTLLPEPSSLQMAHVPCVRECDPAHARDLFEERRSSHIVRGVEFAVVNKRWRCDLWQTRNTSPAHERAGGHEG